MHFRPYSYSQPNLKRIKGCTRRFYGRAYKSLFNNRNFDIASIIKWHYPWMLLLHICLAFLFEYNSYNIIWWTSELWIHEIFICQFYSVLSFSLLSPSTPSMRSIYVNFIYINFVNKLYVYVPAIFFISNTSTFTVILSLKFVWQLWV